jgi:cytoskeletal protein CcmA (bactofilin family)
MNAQDTTQDATVGTGVELRGKLSFERGARIDGAFSGEITAKGVLVIGPTAKVDALVRCDSAIVAGEISGTITASESIELQETARVTADLAAPALVIARGAVFDGNTRMSKNGAARQQERRKGRAADS